MLKLNKYRLSSLLLIFMVHNPGLKAQFLYYDSLTYAQYLNEDWKNLLKSSREAISKDQDYYYMRMRRGIAYYERNNYVLAERNFKKAELFNSIEPVCKEYIYYSKLFMGEEKDALRYYHNNEEYLGKRLDIKKKPVTSFSIDMAYLSRLDKDYSSNFEADEILNINGSQTITKNFRLFNFLLSHDLGKNLRVFHGGTYLGKSSYYYLQDGGNSYQADVNNIRQVQYYAGLGVYPGAKFTLVGTVHYIHYNFPDLFFGGWGMGSSYSVPGTSGNFFSGRFAVYKLFGFLKPGLGISVSNLNYKNQVQKDAHLITYPLGNRKLYTISSVYIIDEEYLGEKDSYLSFHNTIGFKSFGNVWFEAKVRAGESRNLVAHDGFSIYNFDEIQTGGYEFSILVPGIEKTFRLVSVISNYHNFYIDGAGNITSLNKIESNSLTIIGEIKWNF